MSNLNAISWRLFLAVVLALLFIGTVFGADPCIDYIPNYKASTPALNSDKPQSPITKSDPQPLIVLVTAKWCSACHTVESLLTKMRAAGELDGFYTMTVDYDENRKLAQALMQGGPNSVPQLIIYRPTTRLVGSVTKAEISSHLHSVVQVKEVTTSKLVPIPSIPPALVFRSPRHPILDASAQAHATFQANRRRQDHTGFQERFELFTRQIGPAEYAEICNESWPEQSDASYDELWVGAVRDWRTSPGHWSVANRVHTAAGFGLQRGRNGVWYSCIDVKD